MYCTIEWLTSRRITFWDPPQFASHSENSITHSRQSQGSECHPPDHASCACNRAPSCSEPQLCMSILRAIPRCNSITSLSRPPPAPQSHFCLSVACSLMSLRATDAPIMASVMAISSAKGKSSGSRSNVLLGCTRDRNRSSPRASARQVLSRLAGAAWMPAHRGQFVNLEHKTLSCCLDMWAYRPSRLPMNPSTAAGVRAGAGATKALPVNKGVPAVSFTWSLSTWHTLYEGKSYALQGNPLLLQQQHTLPLHKIV